MSLETLIFVIFFALVLHNNGVQTYIHFNVYPLFKSVDKSSLVSYLAQFEKGLTVPLLLPYGLTILVNLALLFIRPDDISIVGVIILLILNVSMAGISIRIATPVYNRLSDFENFEEALAELLKINLLRLGVTTVISLITCGLLLGLLN